MSTARAPGAFRDLPATAQADPVRRSDLPREQSDVRRPDRCAAGAFGAARHRGGHFTGECAPVSRSPGTRGQGPELVDANIIEIFTWHTDGRVFEANEEFLRIIGSSREELVSGRVPWTDFTLPEGGDRGARVLEELKEGRAHCGHPDPAMTLERDRRSRVVAIT